MEGHIEPNTPLLVIDVQKAFDHPSWGERNNLEAEAHIVQLIESWRAAGRPIIFVQHLSQSRSSLFHEQAETSQFKDCLQVQKGDVIIRKYVNSAFIGTDLEQQLRALGCSQIVICGLTTNHCVETTTRMAGNLGFKPILVSDATATFNRVGPNGKMYAAEEIHQMTLVNLHQEFAEIMETQDLVI